MTKIYLNRRLWAIAISAVTITANCFDSSVNSQEVSALSSANKDLSRNKNNATAQTLIGGWTGKPYIDIDNGEHRQQTTFFEPDGTYSSIISGKVGWYLADEGTWNLENNTLYQTSEMTGEKSQGAINFASDKYVYTSSTSNNETTWQKVAPNPNLSAEQLIGTWAIEPLDIRDGQVVPDLSHFTKMELKLVELNADGTFRYQSSNLTVPGYLKEGNANGTWEYINNGLADGILILKNSQGQTISVSSVNWSSEGDYFVNINRTDFDPAQDKWITGKAEKFIPTDQNIN